MKKSILNLLIGSSLLVATANAAVSDKVIAGYLDATATGSALEVDMKEAASDGYNMLIVGFGSIAGTQVDFYNQSTQEVSEQQVAKAKAQGMKTLVSIGGQVNTFNPGDLSSTEVKELAQNIVDFAHKYGFDGIDFDIEVHIDEYALKDLLSNIHDIDSNILLTAAPQINNGRIVTAENNEDYKASIDAGLFDYLFLQEYNTPPQNESNYISSTYPDIKRQVSEKTKIVIGQPTAAVAAAVLLM